MEKTGKQNVKKVYCSKCDLIFETRDRFEQHLQRHSSKFKGETCPVDTVIGKFVNLFRRKQEDNLE